MNRVDKMFQELKNKGKAALMCYLPSIGPDFRRSLEIVDAFVEGGVDMIELSIPDPAPWLDGAPMQTHHRVSHETGITAERAFELASLVRQRYPNLPILPMGYVTGVVQIGVERFIKLAIQANVDGFELPDYPAIRAKDPLGLHKGLRQVNIYNINFADGISLAPAGSQPYQLLEEIVADAEGFIFLTASPGVTGGTGDVAVERLTQAVSNLRQVQAKVKHPRPILVGFGLTTPLHVQQVVQIVKADAVVVGSAVSRLINRNESAKNIKSFIHSLNQVTKIN